MAIYRETARLFSSYNIAVIAMSSHSAIGSIINYGIRSLIILFGLLLLTGVVAPPQTDTAMLRVFGVIFILFGSYRIATYYTAQKRSSREQERE